MRLNQPGAPNLNRIGTSIRPTTGTPPRRAGWKRHRRTASAAALSNTEIPLLRATMTSAAWPAGSTSTRRTTLPSCPRRRAENG